MLAAETSALMLANKLSCRDGESVFSYTLPFY